MKKYAIATAGLLFFPIVASAQALQPLRNIVSAVGGIINALVPIVMAIALLVFFWGLVKYIRGAGKDYKAGKDIMIAGLLALFIMVSVWGIIHLAQGALGINPGDKLESAPQVGGTGSPTSGSSGPSGTTPVNYSAPSYGSPVYTQGV
jgi:hypothetical protein